MAAMRDSRRPSPIAPPPEAFPGMGEPVVGEGGYPAPVAQARPSPVQIALFLATLLSTLLVGAFHAGANPFQSPASLIRGVPFAVTLIGILLVHEMGHFV